jgi:hypothetical protein
MRADLASAMTAAWEEALDARLAMSPYSPVAVVQALLSERSEARRLHLVPRNSPETAEALPVIHREGPLSSVGVTGFEPATSSSRTKRATKLRHTPLQGALERTSVSLADNWGVSRMLMTIGA